MLDTRNVFPFLRVINYRVKLIEEMDEIFFLQLLLENKIIIIILKWH